jgi:hypothetical protein
MDWTTLLVVNGLPHEEHKITTTILARQVLIGDPRRHVIFAACQRRNI